MENGKTMSFVFRGHVVFEYIPDKGQVIQHGISRNGLSPSHPFHTEIPAFDFCCFIKEDYRLMGEFFSKVHRHLEGEDVELKDIVVN